jgi:hypothetical protein
LVEELAPSVVYLQLSKSIQDMVGRFDEVDSMRKKVKAHLGVDAFWRGDAPAGHEFIVPKELSDCE